jgi:creatinine deaminase
VQLSRADREFLRIAFEEAKQGYQEGGVPVGVAMASNGKLLARGRNGLVQEGNPILHGETACIRNAALAAKGEEIDFSTVTIYTSLSPCAMCAGATILFGIPKIVIGDNQNFAGEVEWLLSHGIEVVIVNDPEIISFFANFKRERPELWNRDIVGYVK